MNNLLLLEKKDTTLVLKISILLLFLFIFITIVFYNIYKGTKIIMPNLEDELREKSKFHLFKSMGWSFLVTILFAWYILSTDKQIKYAVNKSVKI
jgi:hypothetical protein